MKLSQIICYPIKSTKGLQLKSSRVSSSGLAADRNYAVVSETGNILTAREYPKLLQLETCFFEDRLFLSKDLWLNKGCKEEFSEVSLFGDKVKVNTLDDKFTNFISNFLGINASIVSLKKDSRLVGVKYNNGADDTVSLADISPIHLLSRASLDDLNSKLGKENQVTVQNFRPNLVIDDCKPFQEDQFKKVQIGNCVFEVHYKTPRCSLATLNPYTFNKNQNSEPLRTLSKYRKNDKGEVCFGVYLIPRALGEIEIGDILTILS